MSRRTRIKICGVMRPQDAAAACKLGADAIGLIFHPPSPRNVYADRAAEILASLSPFVMPVGVFADAEPQEILDTVSPLGINTVQLNGEESEEDLADLAGLRVIKAIRVIRGELASHLERWSKLLRDPGMNHVIGILMEPGGTGAPGGTGVENDWDEVRRAQEAGAFAGLPSLIAAGGLKPQTVANVVQQIRPYAVDVASGVESDRGMKSEQMIADFISAVRSADQIT
jgi:phosphoribosylanthranilate isomerase